jgi:hypothetical protein
MHASPHAIGFFPRRLLDLSQYPPAHPPDLNAARVAVATS